MKLKYLFLTLLLFTITACATVDVTKTAKGYYEPTNPNDVEIIFTKPETINFIELGSITATQHQPSQTAKMHNSLRAKSSVLGATHVLLLSQGIDANGLLWATGVAIRIEK
jgi:arginine/lysine/ornithine decarboxylase